MRIHRRRFPRVYFRVRRKWKLYLFRIIIILTAVILICLAIDAKLKPILQDYAKNRAINLATSVINDAVNDEITESSIKYTDLITLEKDENGRVSALHTNIIKINTLKTKITDLVIDRLSDMDNSKLTIPLGTLTGVDMFSGLGPRIHVSIVPIGSASAEFGSEFIGAGINQTRHCITMTVCATITVVMPRDSFTTEVETQVDIAETVIVGVVPDTYTYVEDATGGEVTDKIFNYTQ